MIKIIEIENIKGIGSGIHKKIFELDIVPNKPSLLIAPNGFGKSSFCAAFKSLNRDRIKLDKKDFHKEDETNLPILNLSFRKSDNTIVNLQADQNANNISDYFDCFVINNQVKAKGIGQTFSGRTNVSASLSIDPIILIESSPENVTLNYSFAKVKEDFGLSGKVLPNLSSVFSCSTLFISLQKVENVIILERTSNQGVNQRISQFLDSLNNQPEASSKKTLIQFIRDNKLQFLKDTPYLSALTNILKKFDLNFQIDKEIESYLAAIQLIDLYHADKQIFKDFCKRKEYMADKTGFKKLFEDFNTTWVEFTPKEKNNSLILDFPKAHLISNGQRDVLSFIALLEKARKKLKKENCILIIDEVFDYLDDANLVAVQYYTTLFIEEYKNLDRNIYPLILSHLDPLYFKGYVFGRKHSLKTYYLVKSDAVVSEALIKILKQRNIADSIVKEDIEKYLLHFHPTNINRREDFHGLGLKPTWGEADNFNKYVFREAEKYCDNNAEFDPLAVCCAVRKKVENLVFNLIVEDDNRDTFLNVVNTGTSDKLEFAESVGIKINEIYYFLGIIYNESLHWKDIRDRNSNISPAMSRLKNLTIKKLIQSLFK